MRFVQKGSPDRGLDTLLGLVRGAGRAQDVLELLLDYVGARFEGTVIFRRDGDLLVPWLGVDVLHPRGLDSLTVPVEDASVLAHLARHPAIMTGPLSGTEIDQKVARLLVGNPYCQAMAVSIVIGVEVRYVLLACRDGAAGPADKDEYRALLREIAERLSRLDVRDRNQVAA
jgi:hypothetical protein